MTKPAYVNKIQPNINFKICKMISIPYAVLNHLLLTFVIEAIYIYIYIKGTHQRNEISRLGFIQPINSYTCTHVHKGSFGETI